MVSKHVPLTVTKNPARVIAGQRTAELMRQRKVERDSQNITSDVKDPWLWYVAGGLGIVGLFLYYKKKDNKKQPEVINPKVETVQQSNIFHMD